MKEEKIMGKITVETCDIEGLKVITPAVYGDNRGYFMETYNYNDFKAAGIDQVFVQDNQSSSTKGVLRGLHFQINFPQDKLVRVVKGEVFDVAVDLRPGSSTYGKWYGVLLSAENSERSLTILKQVIQMGRSLNMRVLVEGIETDAQERLLKATGCHVGQGYLFAHPVPMEQFFAQLDKNAKK